MQIVNVPMLANPLNWITTFTMVVLFCFALDAIIASRSS